MSGCLASHHSPFVNSHYGSLRSDRRISNAFGMITQPRRVRQGPRKRNRVICRSESQWKGYSAEGHREDGTIDFHVWVSQIVNTDITCIQGSTIASHT